MTPRLTLNLGLRYDYEAVPGPYQNLIQPIGKYVPLPQFSQKPSDKNNIGPRIGFAYDVYGTGKTVLRGGFGMYYGRMINAVILTAYSNRVTGGADRGDLQEQSGRPRVPGD